MKLHTSGEDYLEAIFVLQKKTGAARSIDLARYMGFSKASVSRAVSLLWDDGFLEPDTDGFLCLIDAGKEVAEKIYERHRFLTDMLIKIGVPPQIAEQDPCKMEHVRSAETFECLKKKLDM